MDKVCVIAKNFMVLGSILFICTYGSIDFSDYYIMWFDPNYLYLTEESFSLQEIFIVISKLLTN